MALAPRPEPPTEVEPTATLEPYLASAMPAPEQEPVIHLELVELAPEPEAASEPYASAEPGRGFVVPSAEPLAASRPQPPESAAAAPGRTPEIAAAPAEPVPEIVPPQPIAPAGPARLPQVPLRQPRPPVPGVMPWQVVAPDEAPHAAPSRPGAQPGGEAPHRQAGWLARRRENAQPQVSARITRSVWEESTRDLVAHTGSGIQACQACSLPLSATARFCRRCGSRQV